MNQKQGVKCPYCNFRIDTGYYILKMLEINPMLTIAGLSTEMQMTYPHIFKIVKNFERKGLLKIEKRGRRNVITVLDEDGLRGNGK